MYIIFQKDTGIIVDKTHKASRDEQGIVSDNTIYVDTEGTLDFREMDEAKIPADLVGHKYLYVAGGVDGEDVIVPNPDYVEYKSPEQRIVEMEARQAATEEAVLQLILSQPSAV
ncbi:hypothetical protein [Brevibacillus sp. SIMBA_040]|uniref:hypothetical protein n=1 Tax=unclassified Brevibacillus TaxID=2684853 RepID=UPI00397C1813